MDRVVPRSSRSTARRSVRRGDHVFEAAYTRLRSYGVLVNLTAFPTSHAGCTLIPLSFERKDQQREASFLRRQEAGSSPT